VCSSDLKMKYASDGFADFLISVNLTSPGGVLTGGS
jgi:hypothetical protein